MKCEHGMCSKEATSQIDDVASDESEELYSYYCADHIKEVIFDFIRDGHGVKRDASAHDPDFIIYEVQMEKGGQSHA